MFLKSLISICKRVNPLVSASTQVEGSLRQPTSESQSGPGEATPPQGAPIRKLLTSWSVQNDDMIKSRRNRKTMWSPLCPSLLLTLTFSLLSGCCPLVLQDPSLSRSPSSPAPAPSPRCIGPAASRSSAPRSPGDQRSLWQVSGPSWRWHVINT